MRRRVFPVNAKPVPKTEGEQRRRENQQVLGPLARAACREQGVS